MSDDQQWQAPGAPVPPPSFGPPPSLGMPLPPVATPSPPVGSPLSPVGWTPPPKPGLVPLRPMTLGAILGGAFQTLRRNPAATLAPALILTVLVALIQVLGSAGFLSQYLGAVNSFSTRTDAPSSTDASSLASSVTGLAATSLLSGLLSLIVTAIVEAIVTVQVASSTLGSRLKLGGLWRRLRGRRGAVIGWAALTGGAVLISVGIVVLGLIGIGLTGAAGVGIAVLLGFLFSAGFVVVFIWLWVKLGFVPAAIVLERTSIRASMRRSWRLTNGAFWRTFGIRLLVVAMVGVATSIITTPVQLLFSLGGVVLQPNGSPSDTLTSTVLVSTIVTQAVTAIISAVGLVLSTATVALLYLDRRMRLEGLDLDLARFVERRSAGEQGLRDPYLPSDTAAPAAAAPPSAA